MDSFKNIEKIYKNKGYFSKYGGSFTLMIFIVLVIFIVVSFIHVRKYRSKIKENWNMNKCKPSIIPFAGMINSPPGKSMFDYTTENMNYCMNNILTNISNDFLLPIHYAMSVLNNISGDITKDINYARMKFASFSDNMESITKDVMNRTNGIIMPIQKNAAKMKSAAGKMQAVFISGIYTVVSLFYALMNFLKTMKKLAIATIVILVVMIVALTIASIFVPGLSAVLGIFTALSVVLGSVAIYTTSNITKIQYISEHCFDENTVLFKKNGRTILMKNVKIGDVLSDGGVVTSKMKFTSQNVNMYEFNGIIVSGNHSIFYKNNWYKIHELPEAKLITNYKKKSIYCLNTTTKYLVIDDFYFSDYDELEEHEIMKIREKLNLSKLEKFSKKHIHKHLDGGFIWNTKLEMDDGFTKNISEIKINDILKDGTIVKGIIEIDAHDLNVNVYQIDNTFIKSTKNMFVCDPELGEIEFITKEPLEAYYRNTEKIYNLITNTGKFKVSNIQFLDYKFCLEKYL